MIFGRMASKDYELPSSLYKRLITGHLRLLEFEEVTNTPEKTSRANQTCNRGALAPWSIRGSLSSLQPSGLVWRGDDSFMRG